MKPQIKVVSARGPQSRQSPRHEGRAIQLQGIGQCRTPMCATSHTNGRAGNGAQAMANGAHQVGMKSAAPANRSNQGAPAGSRGAAALGGNYRVQSPLPRGVGSHQIRATLQGTNQVAGSVEISKVGNGRAYISNLQVDQQHRRRGVAAKLIDAALAAARRQGFRTASLEARPSDHGISPQALVAMYRRQGFKAVGKSQRGSPLMERKL